MTHLVNIRVAKGFKPTSTLPFELIRQFFDDTFFFGASSIMKVRESKTLLSNYTTASGQCINYQKIIILFFNTNVKLHDKIIGILDFQAGTLPLVYLGLPLIVKDVTGNFGILSLKGLGRS